MITWLLLALITSPAWSLTYKKSFHQKGEPNGIISQRPMQKNSLYFRLPTAEVIRGGKLKLFIEASPFLKHPSNLKVFVDQTPIAHIDLGQTSNATSLVQKEVVLDLPLQLLNKPFAQVEFQFVNVISSDPCLDFQMGSGLVRVTEDSYLELDIDESLKPNVGNYLLTLPETSIIAIPRRTLNPTEFLGIYRLMSLLDSYGVTPILSYSLNNASIAFADVSGLKNENAKKEWAIISHNSKNILHVNNLDFSVGPLLDNLEGLYNFSSGTPLKSDYLDSAAILQREELGLSPSGVKNAQGINWSMTLGENQTRGLQPKKLGLSIIATPGHSEDKTSVYVYVGEELLKIISLDNSSDPQYHEVLFPEQFNLYPAQLRIEVQGHKKERNCGGDNSFFDARILPDTFIEFDKTAAPINSFSSFSFQASQNYEVILTEENLTKPIGWLHQLNYIRKVFRLDPDRIYIPQGKNKASAVINLSKANGETKTLPYQGHKSLSNLNGENFSLIEVKTNNGVNVLNLTTFGNPFRVKTDAVAPDHNDIMIYSNNRIELLDHSTRLQNIPKFSKASSITNFLERYRYWLLGLAWLVLTYIFLKLGKKFK